jgi:hypothetical protein|tara:strand:+ start:28 stop:993 length:966 start_codon:yes stop_codon:yes gene_type:complete
MLYRSGENLFEGAKSFVDENDETTLFSAYLKLHTLKKLNDSRHIKQIIVRWEIEDLYKKVSDIELYNYCLENNIVLYRNTRIHLKAFWNNNKSVFFGSANISRRGIEALGEYNFELNGKIDVMTFADQSYLNKIILDSEYVTEALHAQLKNIVESIEVPNVIFPKHPTPPPTVDSFLINQLPMTSSPELLFKIYSGDKQEDIEMNCAAHDLELYRIPKNLNETDFYDFLKETFNQHLFIQTFKEAIKTATNDRKPERNGSMQFGAVRRWFSENTTTVPTPRSFELTSYVQVLYVWICYFDKGYSWDVPSAWSQVIYYQKQR